MTLRLPQTLSTQLTPASGASVLDAEILAEKAASLGVAGRKVDQTLNALRAFDARRRDGSERDGLLRKAGEAVWGFLVQRELCGLTDQETVIRDYDIPVEVLCRMGVRRPADETR